MSVDYRIEFAKREEILTSFKELNIEGDVLPFPRSISDDCPYLEQIIHTIQKDNSRLRKTREKVTSELIYEATRDDLTGLLRSKYFRSDVDKKMNSDESIAILYIDLDRFKLINDTLGHDGGDEVLKEVTKVFSNIRGYDTLVRLDGEYKDESARMGGDEFAIVLTDVTIKQAYNVARRMADDIKKINAEGINLGSSIGIAYFESPQNYDSETAIKNADSAMYRAKHPSDVHNGRDAITIYNAEREKSLIIPNS